MLPMLLRPTGISAETGNGASTAIVSPECTCEASSELSAHRIAKIPDKSEERQTSHAGISVGAESLVVSNISDRPECVFVAVHPARVIHQLWTQAEARQC